MPQHSDVCAHARVCVWVRVCARTHMANQGRAPHGTAPEPFLGFPQVSCDLGLKLSAAAVLLDRVQCAGEIHHCIARCIHRHQRTTAKVPGPEPVMARHRIPTHESGTWRSMVEEHVGARARVCVRVLFVRPSYRATASSSNCSMISSAISYLRNLPVSLSQGEQTRAMVCRKRCARLLWIADREIQSGNFGRTAIPAAPPIAGSRRNIRWNPTTGCKYAQQAWME